MIELKLKRTALRWDFSFFAVLAVFFIWDYSGFGFAALGICTAHELAHLAVMRLCGMSPDSLTFYGAGIRLSASAVESAPPGVQAAVYAAGCAMNLLLGGVFLAAGEARIAAVSFAAGAFNLLPLGEFDGRRLLKLLLISRAAPENVDTALRICGIISAVIAGAVLFKAGGASPTFFITASYLVILSAKRL